MRSKTRNIPLFVVIIAFGILLTGNVYSQKLTATSLKFGYYNPKDASSGLMFGLNQGYIMDETVDIGFSVDLFKKSYKKDTEIAKTVQAQEVTEITKQRDAEFSTIILPIMATVNVKIPVSQFAPAFLILGGGFGWEMMFNSEHNYVTDKKESRFYHGFGYMVSVGMLYQIGSRSALFGEMGYNGCKVSRDHKVEAGTPVWDEVNISGPILRVGLRIGIL